MKKIFYFSALSAILLTSLFSSCEKDAGIALPETPPKLVLVSFITPQDTILSVTVKRSQPIFESYSVNTSSAVTDATVIMAGSSGSVQLVYNLQRECYEIASTVLPVIAGNSYTLTVTTPRGESVKAETTVPYHSGVAGFSVTMTDSASNDMGFIQISTDFNYSMTDYAGEENRYRFFSAVVLLDTLTNDTTDFRYMNQLFTDNNKDGQQIQSSLHGDWANYDPANTQKVIGYDCWMFNVNKDYYNYHNSLYNYSGDDPFSEPTIIYTNVDGGLGVFAAANGSKIRIYR
ncbi:MAG: DUF4249 domain-containing protein [Bacteroidia bacterium]